jgi:hypothetical protein
MNSRPIYDRLRSFCFAFLRPTAKLAGWLGWLAGGASPVPCCFTAIIVSKKNQRKRSTHRQGAAAKWRMPLSDQISTVKILRLANPRHEARDVLRRSGTLTDASGKFALASASTSAEPTHRSSRPVVSFWRVIGRTTLEWRAMGDGTPALWANAVMLM